MPTQEVTKPIALDETLQSTNTALALLGKDTTLQAIVTALASIGINTVGNLASLTTADKSSLVGAVNELVGDIGDLDTDKADKVDSATNGNLAGLDGNGNLTDSEWNGAKDITNASGNPILIPNLKANQLAINPIITLEPIQAGSGTPSPSNIRAISGYDKIEVLSANGSDPTAQGYVKTTDISESLGQTVYGGTLDVRTGKLTVDRAIVDLGDFDWGYSSNYLFFQSATTISNIDRAIYWLSSMYDSSLTPSSGNVDTNNIIGVTSANILRIRDTRYTDATSFKTAVTGQTFCYKLATPFTIQLTPHEISLLSNYAYVSTNGTSIALDYHNGELASLSDVAQLSETVERLTEYIKGLINNA